MEHEKEYASKGMAGTALGFGIGGTALGVLGGGLGNLLGGALGGNRYPIHPPHYEKGIGAAEAMAIVMPLISGAVANASCRAADRELAEKDAEIAKLEAEKYSDNKTQELFNYTVAGNKELTSQLFNINTRLTAIETALPLQMQIVDGKIAQSTAAAECCCKAANVAIANLQAQVASFTKLVIPNSAVRPGWGDVNVSIAPATAGTQQAPANN